MSIITSFSRVCKKVALKNVNIYVPKNSKIQASLCLKNHAKCMSSYEDTFKHLCEIKYQPTCVSIRRIHSSNIIQEKEHFRESESASYEGTGRTTVTILNEDVQYIMIDAISLSGFRLNTGLKAFGPMVVFPNAVLSWRVMDFLEVNERSLSLFTVMEPKPDILIIGYGDRPTPAVKAPRLGYDLNDDEKEKSDRIYMLTEQRNKDVNRHIAKLSLLMKQKKLTIECYPTEDAISAYNYLVSEDRLVAAALIPPNVMKMTSNDLSLSTQLTHGEDPWEMSRSELFTMSDKKGESTIIQVKDWYTKKQE